MLCTTPLNRNSAGCSGITGDIESYRKLLHLQLGSDLWDLFNSHTNEPTSCLPNSLLLLKITQSIKSCDSFLLSGVKIAEEFSNKFESYKNIAPYYKVGRTLLLGSKIPLIQQMLIEKEIETVQLNENFNSIERSIRTIIIAYETAKAIFKPSEILLQSFPDATCSEFSMSELTKTKLFSTKKYNFNKTITKKAFNNLMLMRDERLKSKIQIFSTLKPKNASQEWTDELKLEFAQLSEPREISCISNTLTSIQVSEILDLCSKPEFESMLPYVITSLNDDVFIEILESLAHSPGLLDRIRCQLNRVVRENTLKNWVESKFENIRQTFADSANMNSSLIDMLTEYFRVRRVYEIDRHDLEQINELFVQTQQWERVTATLITLFDEIITVPNTKKTLNDTLAAYKENIARLSRNVTPTTKVIGGVLDIIYQNVFDAYEDEDCISEVFGLWNLTTSLSMWQCGLLGKLTQEEFEEFMKTKNLSDCNKLALTNLIKYGFETIGDLKKEQILNTIMLKAYIDRAQ